MNYKDYQVALENIKRKYGKECERLLDEIEDVNRNHINKRLTSKEAKERKDYLNEVYTLVRSKEKRSIDRLKMNFANQDTPVKIGDVIWANTRVMKVEEIRVAAFDYPMLKYFGTQLTLYGVPKQVQQKYPKGGIYQKEVTSVNGDPYKYKTR